MVLHAAPRQKLLDLALLVAVDDGGERGSQIGQRIDSIELAGLNQRGDYRPVVKSRSGCSCVSQAHRLPCTQTRGGFNSSTISVSKPMYVINGRLRLHVIVSSSLFAISAFLIVYFQLKSLKTLILIVAAFVAASVYQCVFTRDPSFTTADFHKQANLFKLSVRTMLLLYVPALLIGPIMARPTDVAIQDLIRFSFILVLILIFLPEIRPYLSRPPQ